MARTEAEVLLGPGYFYIAPHTAGVPEAPPTFDDTLKLTDDPAGNWEDVGFSEDGWNLIASNEFSDWTPAELVDPIVTVKDSAEYHLRGVLAQFTLENLQLALSGGTISIDDAGVADTSAGWRHYLPASTSSFDYFSALFITQKNDANVGTSENCIRHTYLPYIVSVAELDVPHTKGSNPSLMGIDLKGIKASGAEVLRIDEQFFV